MPPRKHLAKREPNGKPQREPSGPSPTEISRLRDAALAGMKDPIWGTQLGILHLSGKLTSSQLAAGKRWGELARDYSAAVGAPRAPRSAALEASGGVGESIQIAPRAREKPADTPKSSTAISAPSRRSNAPAKSPGSRCAMSASSTCSRSVLSSSPRCEPGCRDWRRIGRE